MTALSLILIILLIASILLMLRFMSPTLSLWIRASNDYRNAKGTKQLRLLQGTLIVLNKKKTEITQSITDLEIQVKQLERRRKQELEIAASKFLVRKELIKVSGIGETLKQRIIQECFDNTLSSLDNVEHINGVESEKALAIRLWVKDAIHRLPEVIQGEFQGKQKIMRQFEKPLNEKTNQRASQMRDLQKVEKLASKIDEEVRWLALISTSTFRRALQGDLLAGNQVSQYMRGSYPQWEEMPKWLKNATKIVNQT